MLKYYRKSERIKFITTFHKPPSILSEVIKNNKYLKYLDGVIALGANKENCINDQLKIKQIEIIPHVEDTNFKTYRIYYDTTPEMDNPQVWDLDQDGDVDLVFTGTLRSTSSRRGSQPKRRRRRCWDDS